MAIISPDYVRRRMPGTQLASYIAAYGDASEQEAALAENIAAAEAEVKDYLQMQLEACTVKCYPDSSLQKGRDYDVEERPYEFTPAQWDNWGFLQLRRRPVASVENVRITFGSDTDIGEIPSSWIRINEFGGGIHIIPTPGATYTSILLQTGGFLAPFLQNLLGNTSLPGTIAVDYVAGLEDLAESDDWEHLRRAIGLLAAKNTMVDVGESKEAGVGSISLSGDGLSESRALTKFEDRVQRFEQDAMKILDRIRDAYTPIPMVSL